MTERLTWAELRAASRLAARKLLSASASGRARASASCARTVPSGCRSPSARCASAPCWCRSRRCGSATRSPTGCAHGDVQVLLTRAGFLKHDYLADLTATRARRSTTTAPGAAARRRVPGAAPGDPARAGGAAARRHARRRALGRARRRRPTTPSSTPLERTVSPTDVATVFFTSGTTAQAKAVVHAHGALTTSGRRIGECARRRRPTTRGGDTCRSSGAAASSSARSRPSPAAGASCCRSRSTPASALALLEAERCTIMAGWHQAGPLLEHPDFAQRRRPAWRRARTTPLADRLLGPDHLAVGMYGMSETATCVACARWDDPPAVRRRDVRPAARRHGRAHRRPGDRRAPSRRASRARSW